jgi:HEAT repeat protein
MKRLWSVCVVLALGGILRDAQAVPPEGKVPPPIEPPGAGEGPVYRQYTLGRWVGFLRSKGTMSIPAEEVLGKLGPADTAAVPVLVRALPYEPPHVQRTVLAALEQIGPSAKAAVPTLRSLLKTSRVKTASGAKTRVYVARALVWIDSKQGKVAAPALKAALTDSDPHLRVAAAEGLVRADPTQAKAAVGVFKAALRSRDTALRISAAEGLAQAEPSQTKAAVAVLTEVIRRSDDSTSEQVLARYDRARAIAALGRLGPRASDASPLLLGALKPAGCYDAADLALALVRIDPAHTEAVFARLTTLSKPSNPGRVRGDWLEVEAREHLAKEMQRVGPQMVQALIVALKDRASSVRAAAARSLGRLVRDLCKDGTVAVPALLFALKDPATEVRAAAAGSLGDIGPAASEALPALRALARTDTEAGVRDAATEALGRISPTKSKGR